MKNLIKHFTIFLLCLSGILSISTPAFCQLTMNGKVCLSSNLMEARAGKVKTGVVTRVEMTENDHGQMPYYDIYVAEGDYTVKDYKPDLYEYWNVPGPIYIAHSGACYGSVTIYEKKNFEDNDFQHFTYNFDYIISDDKAANPGQVYDFHGAINDKMSSLKWNLKPGVTATIFAHRGGSGRTLVFSGTGELSNCHNHTQFGNQNWCGGDCASAIKFTTTQ